MHYAKGRSSRGTQRSTSIWSQAMGTIASCASLWPTYRPNRSRSPRLNVPVSPCGPRTTSKSGRRLRTKRQELPVRLHSHTSWKDAAGANSPPRSQPIHTFRTRMAPLWLISPTWAPRFAQSGNLSTGTGWPFKHLARSHQRPESSLHAWYSHSQSSNFCSIAQIANGSSRSGARPTTPCGLAIMVFDSHKPRRQKTSMIYWIVQNYLRWTHPSRSSTQTLSGLRIEARTTTKMMATTAIPMTRTMMMRSPPFFKTAGMSSITLITFLAPHHLACSKMPAAPVEPATANHL